MVTREPESKKKKRLHLLYRHDELAVILLSQHRRDEPLPALGLRLPRALNRSLLARVGGHKVSPPTLSALSSITP